LAWDESCNSDMCLRANSGISDLAALFRLDTFRRYNYHNGFAEDLELGKRLIKDGHRIGFLYSTRVLHSHNRPAFYFLKRGYVDSRFRTEVFPGTLIEIQRGAALFRDIAAIYQRTTSVANTLATLPPQSVPAVIDRIRALYVQEPLGLSGGDAPEDTRLDEFITRLSRPREIQAYNAKTNMILPHLLAHVAELEKYLSATYETLDTDLMGEVGSALIKMMALHAGNHMGYWYATSLETGHRDPRLAETDKMLQSGI